jgi:hypothetical protein
VGILQRFYAKISRGEPADPNELVELIVVRGASGPMTVARLREDGFDATGHEAYNVATKMSSDFRILVPRHEVERANERLKNIL